ncbi:bacteriohemerythrin [uncultured Thiohalocapsa sp.]|uniref:bacteriohemerythrin n=1 Tax=uncultured Thiohalocapsa sp. TaxID=768990 RepID=UPI0025F037C9|nr:bacteriohemerythrin [uncultured Thiohalocapsa sp.]
MSKLVEWSDSLSVGIEEIDTQHRTLVDLVNELNDAIEHRHGNAVVGQVLGRLEAYTRIHFAVEEGLMRVLGYPDLAAHKREHARLADQLADLRERFDGGRKALGFELMHFLKLWLTSHIMECDQDYARYFAERGVTPQPQPRTWRQRLFRR